jgi:enoyl-CoA hydratase
MAYETILYKTDGPIATITLNRPERLNTIVPPMPQELKEAVVQANREREVRVIVLRGAGRAFCAGFDFSGNLGQFRDMLYTDDRWDPGKDMIGTTSAFSAPVPSFMSLWRSPKPVPYSRVWGCYLTGMWIYRLGLSRAKWLALTGEPLSGLEAAEAELINKAVPFTDLEAEVQRCAERLAKLPLAQLAAMKLIVNQAYENMGLHSTQLLGPILDGYMRNIPESLAFVQKAATEGVGAAIAERDGPSADYSQAPPSRQPSREHVIKPD